ncbi:MAG TPA: CBS domain-containing protein [Rectinemataceae bacterium]|nr:CBS domain-containing protein [Rectinemataceae bacterium]
MLSTTTFYLSRMLGATAIGPDDRRVGRVRDIVVDLSQARPRVLGILAGSGRSERLLPFEECLPTGGSRLRAVRTGPAGEVRLPSENLIYLRKHLLDKQIVDVDGRKLVRVNDLVIDTTSAGAYLVAVDVGAEGLLRRLGIEGPIAALLRVFGTTIPSKLVLWGEVEAVDLPSTQIKLSKAYSKLDGIHPSDLADILEDLDRGSQVAIFTAMDEERAADVLEELEPEAQVKLLENLSEEKAADVLEKMPADEVADILDELRTDKAERLLAEMEAESSTEVRNLMAYPEGTVGSLMSKDYVFFNQSMKVADALAELRAIKPEAEVVYSLFVLDARGKYVATLSLRDLVVAEPEARLGQIMSSVADPLHDDDAADVLPELMIKYKLHSAPVVDAEGRMAGTIVIEDVLERVMRKR